MTNNAETFGKRLRRAREQSGLTLRQIADITKQSVANLSALENDRVAQLPGGIYRRAIVRSYAGEVGLDAEATLRTFLVQYPDDIPTWADLVPTPKARAGSQWLHAIGGVMAAALPVLASAVRGR